MWILSYWILPLISALVWLGMILAMFIWWEARGSPHLPSMEPGQHIAYISDVGAFQLKPLFIACGCVTVVFLDAAFLTVIWLRHTGRLVHHTAASQTWLSWCSMFFALVGSCGLILLTIFDCYHHDRVHDIMLGLFIVGYIISAIFLCAESQRLGKYYRAHPSVRLSFWIKLVFIFVEVGLGIAFLVLGHQRRYNAAAVVEWVIALIFTFYVVSFIPDLWPGMRSTHHIPQGEEEKQLQTVAAAQGKDANTMFGRPYGIRNQVRIKKEQKAAEKGRRYF